MPLPTQIADDNSSLLSLPTKMNGNLSLLSLTTKWARIYLWCQYLRNERVFDFGATAYKNEREFILISEVPFPTIVKENSYHYQQKLTRIYL